MYFKTLLTIFLAFFFVGCANSSKLPEKCYEKGKAGMCKAYFKKYHYNQKTKKCEQYIFGGCGEVVFHTLEECQSTCEK